MSNAEQASPNLVPYRWNYLPAALLRLGLFGAALGSVAGGSSALLFALISLIHHFSFSLYEVLPFLLVAAPVGAAMALPGGILLGWATGFIRNRFGLLVAGTLCGVVVFLPFQEGSLWYDPFQGNLPLHATALASGGITGFLALTLRWKRLQPLFFSGIRYLDFAIPTPKWRGLRFGLFLVAIALLARWVGFLRNYGREEFSMSGSSNDVLREVIRVHDEAPWYVPRPRTVTLVDFEWKSGKQASLVYYLREENILLYSLDPGSGWTEGWDGVSVEALREIARQGGTFETLRARGYPSPFGGNTNRHRRLPTSDEIY